MRSGRYGGLEFAAATHKGARRGRNQDAYYASMAEGVFLVADGMGGLNEGRLAAEIVVEVLPRLLRGRLVGDRNVANVLDAQMRRLNQELQERAEGVGVGMVGAAVVVAVVRERVVYVAHMGDCRAYLVCGERFERLTEDHTVAAALEKAGRLRGEWQREFGKHQLSRFVGMGEGVGPGVVSVRFGAGDWLLLCSDGLVRAVDDGGIADAFMGADGCEVVVEHLMRLAEGGPDDVTVLVVRRCGGKG